MKRITSILLTVAMIITLVPTFIFAEGLSVLTDVTDTDYSAETGDPDALPEGYVDNSNDGMFELQEEYMNQKNTVGLMSANENELAGKKVEIAFLIDASGSMSPYIAKVKENVTAMAQYFETAGVNLRMAVVRYGASEDGSRANVLKINGSSWHTSTEQLVQTLASIPAVGGIEALSDAIGDILHKDPTTKETNVHWSSDAYKFAFVLTNDFDYGVEGLQFNDYGYETLDSTIPDLQNKRIPVSVVTRQYEFSRYNNLATETGGKLYDITTPDYYQLLIEYANECMGVALKAKKAIYILPGYMGSKLYGEDGAEKWADMDYIESDIYAYTLPFGKTSLFTLNVNGEDSSLHDGIYNSTISIDEYGAQDTYKNLVTKLKAEFSDDYDVIFYPYHWLADLNDEAIELQNHINKNGYEKVILVTHSTGGLLASTYIAKNPANKKKVEKAILIAPPLFGTYSSLFPLEYGKNEFLIKQLDEMKISKFQHGFVFSWVKGVVKNSPTTYQLLPSAEYINSIPLIYLEGRKGSSVKTVSEYYKILNGSSNINSNLTNGSKRSHKYLRETVYGGDVIKLWSNNVIETLQEVDTILIGTGKGYSTPAVAYYKSKTFGGTKIYDIAYDTLGDGTVLNISAFAMKENGKHVLKYKDFSEEKLDHTALATNKKSISFVCDYIKGSAKASKSDVSLTSIPEGNGMSDYIKVRYSADKPIKADIYDNSNSIVASVSKDYIFGFGDNTFEIDPFILSEEETDVLLHLPNMGYKVVFSYKNVAGEAVDFTNTVSCLDKDGFKTKSLTQKKNITIENGIIASIDYADKTITKDNISSQINADSEVYYYTEWNLPERLSVSKGESKQIEITGADADNIVTLLNWSTSDPEIADVSESGLIAAKKPGVVNVSATDGNKVLVTTVVVPQQADSVEISDIKLTIDERKLIKPVFVPSYTTETDMEYEMSKDGIIEIDEFGVIHALKAGSVTVTGKTSYGVEDSFVVVVEDDTNYAVESIEISPSTISVINGKTATFKVKFTPENSTNKELDWLIEDDTLFSMTNVDEDFTITGLKEGSTKITAISVDGGYTAEATVKVTKKKTSSGGVGTIASYTVKFETNGGSKIPDKSVRRNLTVTEPETPTKEGYTFEGWYSDKELTKEFDFATRITGATTLYAKWKEIPKTSITLTIGDKKATINGKTVENDVAPKIVNNRTMLPIRFIAEALEAKVEWLEDTRTVKISLDGIEISLVIGESKAFVNGKEVELDVASFIENGRTYLPIRFVMENLGADVQWDGDTQTVSITK